MTVRIIHADVLAGLAQLPDESVHCVVTDPPYGETSLSWDVPVDGWLEAVRPVLRKEGSVWIFGTFRSLLGLSSMHGWRIAQDVVWEKHNGSNAFSDRFRRVHEQAVQLYRDDVKWSEVYKQPLFTNDARARVVRRKQRPPQWGKLNGSSYRSEDGGPRLMRSVMFARSCHGRADHPTQKPESILEPLIEYSCPIGGTVLDPFAGSGSTGIAAKHLDRDAILIELSAEYVDMARRRIEGDAGLFADLPEHEPAPQPAEQGGLFDEG